MPERHTARRALALAGLLLAGMLATAAQAVTFKPLEFASHEREELYRDLTEELRCLVCQNQNLAESDAELAGDLRAEVYRMVGEGASRDDVVSFMVDRYGDFVLYRPPLRPATVLLWVGPFVLATAALFALMMFLRRRNMAPAGTEPLSDAERESLQRLVDDDTPRPR